MSSCFAFSNRECVPTAWTLESMWTKFPVFFRHFIIYRNPSSSLWFKPMIFNKEICFYLISFWPMSETVMDTLNSNSKFKFQLLILNRNLENISGCYRVPNITMQCRSLSTCSNWMRSFWNRISGRQLFHFIPPGKVILLFGKEFLKETNISLLWNLCKCDTNTYICCALANDQIPIMSIFVVIIIISKQISTGQGCGVM